MNQGSRGAAEAGALPADLLAHVDRSVNHTGECRHR
jgi:hypothetical protein